MPSGDREQAGYRKETFSNGPIVEAVVEVAKVVLPVVVAPLITHKLAERREGKKRDE